MANWNGSHIGSQIRNYLMYSNQQHPPGDGTNLVEDWNLFPNNENSNSLLQNRSTPPVYDQNPNAFYHMMNPMVSSGSSYFHQPSTSDMANNQNDSQHSRTTLYNNSTYYQPETMVQGHELSMPKNTHIRPSDQFGYSNLHATANEFVPSNVADASGSSVKNPTHTNVFFADNNSQFKKQHHNTKSSNYKPEVNLQRGRFQKSNYKNYKSYDKFNKQYTYEPQSNLSSALPSTSNNTYESTVSHGKYVHPMDQANHSFKNTNFYSTNKNRKYERNSSNDFTHYKHESTYPEMVPKNAKFRGDRNRSRNFNKRNYYPDYNTSKSEYSREIQVEKEQVKIGESQTMKGNEFNKQKHEHPDEDMKHVQPKQELTDDESSQRERLTEQLNRGQLECLVCCDYIKQNNYIWSCFNCHHVLHLKCIRKWAKSSQSEKGWRCPACQNVSSIIPEEYYCFCGKVETPEWNRRDTAHSCGEVCGRSRSKNDCVHKCNLLCHPGSCPECTAMIEKSCGCGKTTQTVKCSTEMLLYCDAICEKLLNCTKHKCQEKCHHGECSPCEKTFTEECFCGKHTRVVICEANESLMYSCENICDKLLDCGNHRCKHACHSGSCEPCTLVPEKVTTCWCGQTSLTEQRNTCLDPIPPCTKICSQPLKCGQPNNPHTCTAVCHEGDCPDCDLTTEVRCRCNNMNKEIPCKDLTTKADDARCGKKCTKKRQCGKHKCNQFCCIEIDHVCPLPCSKTLSCGKHKCELACHPGRCPACWRSSFDELYCECGAAVIYPPVPCGTRKPACDRPCSRIHSCGHEVLHNCHSEPNCPPCSVLTKIWCYGKHELRKAMPCHLKEISCGLPCNKSLSCGKHKCLTLCHSGPCKISGQQCVQPCAVPRELCGHICGAPCHEGPCPDVPCKEAVKVTCQCGNRSMSRVCAENSKEYQRIASSILASKMADMQLGHSINLDEVFGQGVRKQNQLKTLECNDECHTIERNRRLALGLQIVNPDLSGKLIPRYSDYMKQWAKKDPHFCQMVHDKLTELVQLAKTSKQKSRSYSFDCMNRDKRHFVHESCEHFGCESQAYDQEPKRNIVATAVKDKCWLPSYSLLEIVQRENGQRKVPGPILKTSKGSSFKTVLPLNVKKTQQPVDVPSTSKSSEEVIDYFNFQR